MSSTLAYRLFVTTTCVVISMSLASAQMSKRHHTPSPSPAPDSTSSDQSTSNKPTTNKATSDKSTTDKTTDQSDDGPDFDGVQYVDKKLNSMLTVEKVNTELSPSKLLTIFVDLKNKTHKPLDLQIQTSYADVRNTPLSATDSWVDFPLKSKDEDEYCSVALSADAVKYLVKIRLEPAEGNAETGPGTTLAQLNTPLTTPTPNVADNNTPDSPAPTSTPRPRHVSFSDTLP